MGCCSRIPLRTTGEIANASASVHAPVCFLRKWHWKNGIFCLFANILCTGKRRENGLNSAMWPWNRSSYISDSVTDSLVFSQLIGINIRIKTHILKCLLTWSDTKCTRLISKHSYTHSLTTRTMVNVKMHRTSWTQQRTWRSWLMVVWKR